MVGHAEDGSGHRLVAVAWLRAGAFLVAGRGLVTDAKHALCRGPEVSCSPARLRRALFHRTRCQRCAEDYGDHCQPALREGIPRIRFLRSFLWVVLSCQVAMALGTLVGGWRIVKTM